MDVKEVLLQQFIKFLIKKRLSEQLKMRICLIKNQQKNFTNQLLENLRNENYTHLLETPIWGVDLADMQLLTKFNEGFRFFLCVIDIFNNYVWVISLKNRKGITTANAFQKFLDESNGKPNKIQVDKGSKFYNRSQKSWLEKNDTQMHSTHNEGKSVVVERFIRTLMSKT